MRQIITIQVGGCGNQIGSSFWQTVSQEHHINEQGFQEKGKTLPVENLDVYYSENSGGSRCARSVLVDLESGVVDMVVAGKYGQLFKYENVIRGHSSACNIWAKGMYSQGSQYIDYVTDSIRRESQLCDSLEGFQVMHSVGGGTGSGMGTLILQKLLQQHPHKISQTQTILPSSKISDCILEPYNTVLSFPSLMQASQCMMIDNQALHEISSKYTPKPTYRDLNGIVANAISGVTCGLRFPGELNAGLSKICVGLVPYPRMHFFILSQAQVSYKQENKVKNNVISQIMNRLFSPKSFLSKTNPQNGRYYSAYLLFRGGDLPTYQIERQVLNTQNKNSSYFVQWIPGNMQSSICRVAQEGIKASATMIANTSTVQGVFKDAAEKFGAMFKKRAYLHWYVAEGMEEMEFTEAESDINNLVYDYQIQYNNYQQPYEEQEIQ